jgi:hypothetical protein
MSTQLKDFVKDLNKLIEEGHGEKEVYMIDSRSGCAIALYGAHLSNYIGEAGPYDLEEEFYVGITGDH